MMNNLILGLLAETFIHSGIGCNEGAIDLPSIRLFIMWSPCNSNPSP